MNIFNNHKQLFLSALGLFLVLTLFVALIPAHENEKNNAPLPNYTPMSSEAFRGKKSYIANGCVACHTQQVRGVDMDKVWGDRPGIAADYAGIERTDFWTNTATLMGTERTGPDLSNVGKRQPSQAWNLLHLYQPRAVVEASIMPAYPWLFIEKKQAEEGDVIVNVPENFRPNIDKVIVASTEALDLVAYLQSLQQLALPQGQKEGIFLYKQERKQTSTTAIASSSSPLLPDGEKLYTQNCGSCHQSDGNGLPGAFPALNGSSIVNGDDLELFVNIIMLGYDARPEYAVMPAVGANNKLTAEEVTAIINHERTSWGNHASKVNLEDVQAYMNQLPNAKNL